jgi:hypothetical protein
MEQLELCHLRMPRLYWAVVCGASEKELLKLVMISFLKRSRDFVLQQKIYIYVLIRTCLFRGTYTNLDAKTNFVVRRSDTQQRSKAAYIGCSACPRSGL